MSDAATMKAYIQSLPLPAFLVILVAHAGGALVGGLVAALIARRSPLILGAIVGGFFMVGGIMNAMSLPAPLWFAVIDLILYVPCGIVGAKRRRAAPLRWPPQRRRLEMRRKKRRVRLIRANLPSQRTRNRKRPIFILQCRPVVPSGSRLVDSPANTSRFPRPSRLANPGRRPRCRCRSRSPNHANWQASSFFTGQA